MKDVDELSPEERIELYKEELKRKDEIIQDLKDEKEMIMKLLYKAQDSNIESEKMQELTDESDEG